MLQMPPVNRIVTVFLGKRRGNFAIVHFGTEYSLQDRVVTATLLCVKLARRATPVQVYPQPKLKIHRPSRPVGTAQEACYNRKSVCARSHRDCSHRYFMVRHAAVVNTVVIHSFLQTLQPHVLEQTRLTVVIPTYNEAANLPKLATALFALPFAQLQLVVVDDNSPDGTGRVADELAAQLQDPARPDRPRVVVIHRGRQGGLGTAYVAGMRRALADGADFVVQMDADFSHSPPIFLKCWA